MLPLNALMVTLAVPIVRVVYERYASNRSASQVVASVLVSYGIGMFVYLGRDVLVQVFYALGDRDTPFRISVINIFLNAALDYVLAKPFGAPGVVLATVGVNLISMIMLLWVLDRKLKRLPWREWGLPILGLMISSIIAGFVCWGTLSASKQVWGTKGLLVQLSELNLLELAGLSAFTLFATQLKIAEVELVLTHLRQRFIR